MDHCKHNLLEIKSLLSNLNTVDYSKSLSLLSASTIGQHVRHILEFYTCLIASKNTGIVNYDNRKRNIEIETNIKFAQEQIDWIIENLMLDNTNIQFNLEGNYTTESDEIIAIPTTYQRELAYCLEHSIHHQALIKVGLKELELENVINENFGVAPATIRHKKQCAQ
ncbi:DinB family protein [Vicingus serpentipes]|uniref:DinB family protein n=1 Tax=Vicingus serpentipes TaxID=1926625 RepID=A0A5C6RRF7_9FLAO|nr:DinB family protein [Vicingus serpentipes]TXB64843.1 DinB family protein [Vicingus serpentipes]